MARIILVIDPARAHQRRLISGVLRGIAGRPDVELRLCPWAWYRPRQLTAMDGDALIIHGRAHVREDAELARRLGLPTICVGDEDAIPGATHIGCDDDAIGAMAAEHLAGAGWRRLIYLGYPKLGFNRIRSEAFQRVGAARGMQVEPDNGSLAFTDHDDPERRSRRLGAMLRGLPAGSAVGAINDTAACELAIAASAQGLRIGEDLALLGCGDDDILCHAAPVPLSSVITPSQRIGELAAAAAIACLDRGRPQPAILGPLGVATRRSTDPAALADGMAAEVMRHLRRSPAGRLSITALCRTAHVSRRTLEQRFRRATGTTIQREHARIRLESACILLAGTDLSVAAIAARTGFASPQRLHDLFQRRRGERLGAWRRRHGR
jgi:LacI family transcriptional regulator